jgi:hypothetical protein
MRRDRKDDPENRRRHMAAGRRAREVDPHANEMIFISF